MTMKKKIIIQFEFDESMFVDRDELDIPLYLVDEAIEKIVEDVKNEYTDQMIEYIHEAVYHEIHE